MTVQTAPTTCSRLATHWLAQRSPYIPCKAFIKPAAQAIQASGMQAAWAKSVVRR